MTRDKSRTPRVERMNGREMMAPVSRSLIFDLIVFAVVVGLTTMMGLGALSGCASEQGEGEAQDVTGETGTAFGGAENTETGSDEGEESGDLLALDETYDFVRRGARLILHYDASSNTFVGTVQNTTEGVLNRVRVEVHLSNGTELGPMTPVDLAPDQLVEVSLVATEETFTGWTPHAEVGEGEHGSGGEGGEGGEHGSGGEGGEHGEDSESGGEHGGGGEGGEHRRGGEGGEGEEHGSGS